MNNTTAIILGAVVIAGAAAAAVWWTRKGSTPAAPEGRVTPAITPSQPYVLGPAILPPQQQSYVPAAPRPAPAPDLGTTIGNAVATVGNIINTGSKLVSGVTNLFKGFKLF